MAKDKKQSVPEIEDVEDAAPVVKERRKRGPRKESAKSISVKPFIKVARLRAERLNLIQKRHAEEKRFASFIDGYNSRMLEIQKEIDAAETEVLAIENPEGTAELFESEALPY